MDALNTPPMSLQQPTHMVLAKTPYNNRLEVPVFRPKLPEMEQRWSSRGLLQTPRHVVFAIDDLHAILSIGDVKQGQNLLRGLLRFLTMPYVPYTIEFAPLLVGAE
jgi:hypothetical protein